MVVTGSCLRMSTSEMGCQESQKADERFRAHRGVQASCHLNSRSVENTVVTRQNVMMENRSLVEVDQEVTSGDNAVVSDVMTVPAYENVSVPAHHPMDGHYFGTKGDMVFSLLSVLGTHNKEDMSRTLLAMSTSFESCVAMRQSGCLPLLIHLLHGSENDAGNAVMRSQAAAALHNIVHVHCEDQRGRQEARVLRLLEQIRGYCDHLRLPTNHHAVDHLANGHQSGSSDYYPGPAVAALMKLSFDEEHRHAVCTLGGVQAIGELLQMDHEINGSTSSQYHVTMRRYACMALTNLTFGDGTNKALLCSMVPALKALVQQLESLNEDLCQVAASVLRNLSWHADFTSKRILRDVGAVSRLTRAALVAKKESTLKSLLSALWNFSSHCIENKADICATEGALPFLVKNLTYRSPLKTLSIIENCGGILRNVSSHIAIHEDHRAVLRQHGCLQILLKHLRSPSLTVVSNACGTLWNLSARCVDDQKILLELGAVNMLKNLVHSKHKMISMGSAAALKNLLSAMPALQCEGSIEPSATLSVSKSDFPGLHMRRQRALESELEQQNLSETCDNMESPQVSPSDSPKMEMHAKPNNNHPPSPVIELLTGSVSRMNPSLRTQLPADVGHVFQASFDGLTDRKRVSKILHRNNNLQDRQPPPVVFDSVALGVRDMKSTGCTDLMYGSHSQLQDVKMMNSFSSCCEPTASTSPETSPTGRNMILDSTRRLFHPRSNSRLMTKTSADEDVFAKSDAEISDESCHGFFAAQTSRPGFSIASEERDSFKSAELSVGFQSDSAFGKTDFTQNRLSIACSENLFSFDSENSEIRGLSSGNTNNASDRALIGRWENASAGENNCSKFENSVYASPPSCGNSEGWGHAFAIEDIQSIASKQPTTGIHKTNFHSNSALQEKETRECPDSQKPHVTLRRNGANASNFFQKDEQQVNVGNKYAEKYLQQNSNSGDIEYEELHDSPNPFSHNDTFDRKVSLNHDFRRLSSAGSHGDDSQDDDYDLVQDGDDIVIEELPVALNETLTVGDEMNDDKRAFDLKSCLHSSQDTRFLDVLQGNNDNIMSVPSCRSFDILNTVPPAEFQNDTSLILQPKILNHSANVQDMKIVDYALNIAGEVSTDSRMDVLQLVNDERNANCFFQGNELFSSDCFNEQTSNEDTNAECTTFLDELLRPEIKKLECANDGFSETEDFVLVNSSFEEKRRRNVLRDAISSEQDDSCDPCIAKVDGCNVTESFRSTSDSIIDIMNESFPELSSSLISEMTASHEDFLASEGNRPDRPFILTSEIPNFEVFEVSLGSQDFPEVKDNNRVAKLDGRNKNLVPEEFASLECDHILLEQELELEENARIILSELEKTTLLGSVVSETRLLEFETLSLVSNDEEDVFDHDDVSEDSYSLSTTSISQSEPSSERCLSAPQAVARIPGPRIVKPVAKDSQSPQETERESGDGPKAIHGRRKLLYNTGTNKRPGAVLNTPKSISIVHTKNAANGRISNASAAVQSRAVEKPNIVKPVRPLGAKAAVVKSNTRVPDTPENAKKSAVRSNRSVTPSSMGQAKPRAPSLTVERKPLPPSRQVKSAPVRPRMTPERSEVVKGTVKKTFRKPATDRSQMEKENLVDPARSVLVDPDENPDRPKPPIKQDTFVKDAPSFSVVVVDGKNKETSFCKKTEKEINQVSRNLTQPGFGFSGQRFQRSAPTFSGTAGTRQPKSDVLTRRKNLIPGSQIGRPPASYSAPSTAMVVTKFVSGGSAGSAIKTGTFTKKPPAVSNVSPAVSSCSVSSAGKTSRGSSGYADTTRTRASDERIPRASPKLKVTSSEKSSQNLLPQKPTQSSDRPAINKTEKLVQVVQQSSSRRSRALRQPVRRVDVSVRAPVVSTLTRSSTYDKLTEDDFNARNDQLNDLTSDDCDSKSIMSKEIEVRPNDVDPRRLTHLVESSFNFNQSFSIEDDEECNKYEPDRITKSQDCAELTLSLNTEFSITDPLYSDRSLTLDGSTVMMNDNILESHEEPKAAGALLDNHLLNFSRSTRTSSTLPRSLFSTHREFSASLTPGRREQSAKAVPGDEFIAEDDSKLCSKSVRCKESRKLGFGLWRRSNVSAKGKPECEERQDKVLHKTESKAGSPVHKVFGWFRKAGESGRKGLTSKIPGLEASKSAEASNSDNCTTKASYVNSNQTQKNSASCKGTDKAIGRQVGLGRINPPLKAAIVQPFNYRPLVKVGVLANEIQSVSSQEPMTKTEMLLARRRLSRAVSGCKDGINSEDNLKLGASDKPKKLPNVPGGKGPKSGFLVTSV